MGEVKSVKVDNWGVFFLQKLQNFFNKTDYCDLTLQFRDNSQLKVHRLVLSACTDYFNVLEQTCEIIDDALIMPNEFQADVVVPIVNFMYTGTLEFELKMYGKLLRTAKEMNMTVLLKLLEAHRRTMENVNRQQRPPSPKGIRRRPMGTSANVTTTQQRPVVQTQQHRPGQVQNATTIRRVVGDNQNAQRGPGSTLLRPAGGLNNRTQEPQPTSPFEQLRKGYNNNKRPAQTSLLSPPSKKPSLEDVKEFAEQQRMRKQIAAEYGDNDPEYESMMLYDDVHTGDDDDDDVPPQPSTSKQQQQQQQQQVTAQSGTQTTQLEHGTTTIILKQDSPSQTPTIIVKDSSNAKLNHTKIIAEVLRQYPHIVKGHKNIKLKIMPNTPNASPEKAAPAPPPVVKRNSPAPPVVAAQAAGHKKLHVSFKPDKATPMITSPQKTPLRETIGQKVATTPPTGATTSTSTAGSTPGPQKRRIDSKTMHSLIALGAENTTGPWLCLRCGVNGRPISIPSYRGFRRHLVNTHKETIDPALCEHCGWRSSANRELHFHMYQEHQVKSLVYTFAECALCNQSYQFKRDLEQHINEAHTDDNNKQQCIYCNKVFAQELQLYRHMKAYHKLQALDDGIIDETDEEYLVSQDDEEEDEQQEASATATDDKVRILSDISLPTASAPLVNAPQEQQEEQEVKFVGADGNEVELTEEQRKEILSQLSQQQAATGGVVMVLSEPEAEVSTKQDENENKSQTGTEDGSMEYDDSQIYSELAGDQGSKKNEAAASADESKESIDNLEWAENLISEQELAQEQQQQQSKEPTEEKRRDDISEKLKELTGDWTEDENEDDLDEKLTAEKSEPAAATEKAQNETEDDIDLALQSLHKSVEEESQNAEATATTTTSTDSTSTQAETKTKKAEEMEVDEDTSNPLEESESKSAKNDKIEDHQIEDDLPEVKQEDDADLEFIKEPTASTESTEAAEAVAEAPLEKSTAEDEKQEEEKEEEAKATTANDEDEVHLEAENIRKELLDELIAEADKSADKDESIDEDSVPPTELTSAKVKEESESPVKPAENNESKDKVIANEKEKAAAAAAPATEEEATAEEAEKANTSEAASSKSTAAVADAASAEKVKSLISEWDDDDEVSAAAKEDL